MALTGTGKLSHSFSTVSPQSAPRSQQEPMLSDTGVRLVARTFPPGDSDLLPLGDTSCPWQRTASRVHTTSSSSPSLVIAGRLVMDLSLYYVTCRTSASHQQFRKFLHNKNAGSRERVSVVSHQQLASRAAYSDPVRPGMQEIIAN